MGVLVREAIDRSLVAPDQRRAHAAARILSAPPMDVPADPSELVAELDALRGRRG